MNQAKKHDCSTSHLYLYLIDLDHFKEVNDAHGHVAGDFALKFVAASLTKLAKDATIARYGGDEFAIFIKVHPDKALQLAEEFCRFFNNTDVVLPGSQISVGKVSVSAGAALFRPDDTTDSWFKRADKLLYDSKKSGRNRAMVERKRSE